ncbi:MAG: cellulase family glycosylhydrolase [Armatimonadota bacterium]|jgi:hypothetical protein
MRTTALALLLCFRAATLAADIPLHDFDDLSVWAPNRDGGNAPVFEADGEYARDGAGMRIQYVNGTPTWGNLTGPCQVPRDATALRVSVYKHAADAGAAMHIWLFEPDNDGWLQRVPFGEGSLTRASVGWHEIRMPIAAFGFRPRGPGTRQMTTVDRMLIGCNYGDLEVTVDSMNWEVGPRGTRLPLPRTADLQIGTGKLGSVGILDMGDGLPEEFATAHPPAALAEALRGGGFGVTMLKPGDLADAGVLTREHFDAVALPFGPYFPLEAREAFLAYLKAGGSFLSTDGYAFDELVVLTDSGWLPVGADRTAEQMDEPDATPPRMNTRFGTVGDSMRFEPDQIGVFDPSFHLEHATRFRLAEWHGQREAARGPRYEFEEPVTGFSACAMIGLNSPVFPDVYRRWVPVLEAFDARGDGLRGTALSMVHNYDGPFAGSSWAFSGITSGHDVFLGDAKRRELLLRVVGDITAKVFLHELKSDFACYEPGETAPVSVQVSNRGRAAAERTLALNIGDREFVKERLRLGPGATETIEASIAVDELEGDYCAIRATLHNGERLADLMESAFCVRSEAVLAGGPKIGWADNYMTVDGRPTFLVGTNQTGMMFASPHEDPAVWDRDLRAMAEHGVHLLRILHFSPFAVDQSEGRRRARPLDLRSRPKRLIRQTDAIVQLAQKHRVAIFLAVHDWMNVTLTDEELAAQADWNRFWADRYRDVPGILYDVQNEPRVDVPDRPDVVAMWDRFVQGRHGAEAARVPLGDIGNDWADARSADRKRFEAELLNRWVKANVDGIRAGDPDALVCVGYLPMMSAADKILGVEHTDFSNMHYYGPVDRFPQELKLIDRRFVGKGFSLGEFGAREAHDARTHGRLLVPTEESIRRFQTYIHYAAGMGAAFIANWDWKDFDEMVFPWGLVRHSSYITKPWLHTLEHCWLLLSLAEPAYESPEIFVLAPDSHRIGPRFDELHGALRRSVELVLDQRVDFGVINEEHIEHLPESARALVWPVPYCPADETFERVLAWVQAGGTLYVSGDVAFDRRRKPTRAERRAQLGLPEAEPTGPFETPEEAWARPAIEASVGAGKVLYVPYPLELREQPTDGGVYRRLVALAGLSPTPVQPADAPVRALSIPTRDGGRLYMLARLWDGEGLLAVSLPGTGVTVELAPGGCAFVLVGPAGEIRAVESQRSIAIDGEVAARAGDHFAICALDTADLRRSRRVLVLPHQCERVDVGGLKRLRRAQCYVGLPSVPEPDTSPVPSALTFSPGTPGQVAVIAPRQQMATALDQLRDQLALRTR